jgi:hypothetical protein
VSALRLGSVTNLKIEIRPKVADALRASIRLHFGSKTGRDRWARRHLGLVATFVFLRPAPAAATVAHMTTVAAKKPSVRKVAVRVRRPAAKATVIRAIDEKGRLIPGYSAGLARVRPGVDLSKPTLAPGKYFA